MKLSQNIVEKHFDRFFKYFWQKQTDFKWYGIIATGFPIAMNFESSENVNFFPSYGTIRPPAYNVMHRQQNSYRQSSSWNEGTFGSHYLENYRIFENIGKNNFCR